MKKFIFVWLTAAAVLLSGCSSAAPWGEGAAPQEGLYGAVLDTGKSDASVITIDGETVIIDTGEAEDAEDILGYLSQNGITYIECLIITQFDKDHVGGAAEIINNVDIGSIITPDYEKDSDEYLRFDEAYGENGLDVERLTEPVALELGNGRVSVYPSALDTDDDNNLSLVTKIEYADRRLMFMGDAEQKRLSELFGSSLSLECDLIKVPHHGRDDGDASALLAERAEADYAVITDSFSERADSKVVKAYEDEGAEVFCTRSGAVYFMVGADDSMTVLQD